MYNDKRDKCEWFEVGSYRGIYGYRESYTVYEFDNYEEAVEWKKDLQNCYPSDIFFIDGWINEDNPECIWAEKELKEK